MLDVRLPRLSGLDLQTELRRRKIHTSHRLYHRTWRYPDVGSRHEGRGGEFLTKPFREQDLLDAIQHAIDQDGITRQHSAELRALQERYALLTSRETRSFPRVNTGLLNKQIAAKWAPAKRPSRFIAGR